LDDDGGAIGRDSGTPPSPESCVEAARSLVAHCCPPASLPENA
jgi:hypothetical protein